MIVIKEEFVGSDKYRRAAKLGGSDAIVLWLALKCYASKYPRTLGFIPSEAIADLPGAPKRTRKAFDALLACGELLPSGERGAGLVEWVDGGWQLHDYLDHSVAPEELELRKEKARLKKQRQRAEQRQELEELREIGEAIEGLGQRGDMSPGTDGGHVPGTPRGDNGGASPRAGARPPASASPRVPNPTLPSPPHFSKEMRRTSSDLSARRPGGAA